MKKLMLIVIVLMFLNVVLSGCHTTHGIAKDLHGVTGVAVDATGNWSDSQEVRDIGASQARLNRRVSKMLPALSQ